ncbi:MAG: hypothetical protein QGH46_07915 [Gammaproteobacteria bacterium]|jgi:hypothetical protein|nr:hypothetical protein [Gammaproteobacteria bacterium]MDP7094231.1 hypothetical protein [Gammaproteobacteria bacterium]MDP7269832.1 hypothetical protein [Gammaproteobacteria bacterium]HJP03509.1 hypothetical protein [Gammaproteobacteria bacterium]
MTDTVITRIMKKFRKADPMETLEAPREAWTQSDEEHGATTKLMMSLGSEEIGGAPDTPWGRQEKSIEHKHQYLDAAGEPVHTEIQPILTEEQQIKLEDERKDTRERNNHGKKTDGGGGFNPYE